MSLESSLPDIDALFAAPRDVLPSPGFIKDIYVEHPEMQSGRPRNVLAQTSILLGLYFTDHSVLDTYIKDFLQNDSLTLVKNIRAGVGHYQKAAKLAGRQYIDDIIDKSSSKLPTGASNELQDQVEAFDLALTTFWQLPGYKTDRFQTGFSASGNLQPPQTIDKFLWRTYELYTLVSGVADGSIPPNVSFDTNIPLLRAYAFFKKGGEMQIYAPTPEYPDKRAKRLDQTPLDKNKQFLENLENKFKKK
jgi:hypothetical protein